MDESGFPLRESSGFARVIISLDYMYRYTYGYTHSLTNRHIMKMKHFNITALIRQTNDVVDEAEKGPVGIRRQSKPDLVLMTADDFHQMFDVAIAARSNVADKWGKLTRVEE